MKKIIVKIVISIAIGIIAGEIGGNFNKIDSSYYYKNSQKCSIPFTNDKYYYNQKIFCERKFNKSLFITISSITSSIIIILLLVPELKNKET